MKLRVLAEADLEFIESVLYYAEQSPAVASRFIDTIENAFHEIQNAPLLYRKEIGEIRIKVLSDFPLSIRYEVLADEILILAISHQARTPEYWEGRA